MTNYPPDLASSSMSPQGLQDSLEEVRFQFHGVLNKELRLTRVTHSSGESKTVCKRTYDS